MIIVLIIVLTIKLKNKEYLMDNIKPIPLKIRWQRCLKNSYLFLDDFPIEKEFYCNMCQRRTVHIIDKSSSGKITIICVSCGNKFIFNDKE